MTEDSLIGKQLAEYKIEALLGQGGMARVYRAVDVRLKRQAVIKLIDPPSRNDPGYMMRFEREAQIIGRLDHSNIVSLYRFDEQDGWLYMAMQYVEGADLGVVLKSYRADQQFMEPDAARRVIHEVCSALDYAHRNGIIHRDVKPANILLDRQGRAYLSDFGLSLITEVGTRGEIFGSAHYISPEQAVSSAKAVPQSDLYAIGVILYEIFTGDVPFKAATPLDLALLHISEPPVPPRQLRSDINPELEAVILKALAKKPEERFPTGAALSDALDLALNARAAATMLAPPSPVSRQTIPERVALELGQQQLPPVPAGVAASIPLPGEKLNSVEPSASPANKQPLIYMRTVIAIGMIILLFCFGLVAIPLLIGRLGQGEIPQVGQTPSMQVTQLVTEPTVILPISTIAFAEDSAMSPAALPDTASLTAPPLTATPSSYELLIVRGQGNDSVIVANQSENAFPLKLLRLVADQDVLNGAEWGLENLGVDQCVGVWKENKGKAKRQLPEGLDCRLRGTPLVRDKKGWFGEGPFMVFYNGKQVGRCDKDLKQCTIEILP